MTYLFCGLWIFSTIALGVLLDRAGEHWWAMFIPLYNRVVNYDIALGDNGIVAVAIICDIVRVIASCFKVSEKLVNAYVIIILIVWAVMLPVNGYMYYNLGKAFGKSKPWCIAMILFGDLLIIPMAFSYDCQYIGPKGVAPVYKTLHRDDETNEENHGE